MSLSFWRIKDWELHFENNRTRDLRKMAWVPIPNKMDGDGYTELLDHPNGPSHFAAWIAMVEIASRCTFQQKPQEGAGKPQEGAGTTQDGANGPHGDAEELNSPSKIRGRLIRDGGRPHDTSSLSRLSRIPKDVFAEAIPRLVEIGWLEYIENEYAIRIIDIRAGAGKPQEGAGKPQEGAGKPQEGDILTCVRGTERNGTERKEEKNSNAAANGECTGVNGKPNGVHTTSRLSYLSDKSFNPFVLAACTLWPDIIPEDLQESWQFTWRKWDLNQKRQCVANTNAQIEAGVNGKFVTRPPKYLESGAWKRPPRVDKSSTQETPPKPDKCPVCSLKPCVCYERHLEKEREKRATH